MTESSSTPATQETLETPEAPARRPIAPYIVLAVALVVGGFFVLLAGSKTRVNKEDPATPLLGRAAPEIVGPTLQGNDFQLTRRRGSWVVLNFFQSTCVPCVREHPELIAFDAQQAGLDDGAELVSIIFDDTTAAVRQFFADNGGGTWPVVATDGASVDYGVSKVPETWIIDPDGLIQTRIISEVSADGLAAMLEQLRVARSQRATA